MSVSAHAKGRLLEHAVELIERHILTVERSILDTELTIEPRKIISSNGVRHEIDLYVQVHAARGYDSVFIFECKNRKPNVDKNDIIVFSEKIDITGSQRGFFIARGFGADAVARAALDPRMTLAVATVEELEDVVTFSRFVWRNVNYSNVHVQFASPNDLSQQSSSAEPALRVHGQPVNANEYTAEWRNLAGAQAARHLTRSMVGEHKLTIDDRRTFDPGYIVFNDVECSSARLTADMLVRIHQPKIIVRIGVEGRGRAMRLETLRTETHEIETWISYSDDEQGALRVEQKFTSLQTGATSDQAGSFEISILPMEVED
jgi:hypothetical protein